MLYRNQKVAPRISLGNDNPTDHIAVLEALTAELDRRIQILKETERDQFEAASPVDESENPPCLLVVLEELPGIMSVLDNKGKHRLNGAFTRLVAEGNKANLKVLILAQRADTTFITGFIRSNLSHRWLGRSDNLDAVRMVHDNTEIPDSILGRISSFAPGVALYGDSTGAPRLMRSYVLSKGEFETPYKFYLHGVREALDEGQSMVLDETNLLRKFELGWGIDENSEVVRSDILRPFMGILASASRGGKTNTASVLLYQLAHASPAVQVVGCDPSGLLLAPFAEFYEKGGSENEL